MSTADEHEARYAESLGLHTGGGCDCEDECVFPMEMLTREEVQDMKLERDHNFGDRLVRAITKRKTRSKAGKFFERWRKTS